MNRPAATARRRATVLVLLFALLGGVLGWVPGRPAEAADLGRFQPGDIISDAFFFDGWAMTAGEVQAFLDQKGASCRTGADGTPCLRVFRQDTPTRPADGLCGPYAGAPQETAATIITKVARACGVSPRVILVMLQKEQALVTNTGSSLYANRYRSAMGFRCPDTAPCDPAYAGFINQVYSGARQFKNYAANPGKYGHRVGQVNQVRFHPNSACGSASVFILNQATAGLYNYTPYQPNAAALRAGYGTGDGCSAYGNRNFYSYFVDWFGSTHEPGAAQISDAYYRAGPGSLGAPTGEPACGPVAGGCHQFFERGAIYWSPGTGARILRGAILSAWSAAGWEVGALGYPVMDEVATADGVGRLQHFQGGAIFWSPTTGARVVRGGMLTAWVSVGADTGAFGFPTSGELLAADGVGRLQQFQGGTVFWSPTTGAHPIRGAVFSRWAAMGADTGVLGYPVSGELVAADGVGSLQQFQGGSIFWSPDTGAQPVRGALLASWARLGADSGVLGYPTAPEGPGADGVSVVQQFQGGTVHWTPATGGHSVLPRMAEAWTARGGATGSLGFPVGEQRQAPDGVLVQDFERGMLVSLSPTRSLTVQGAVHTTYRRFDADAGVLGLPLAEETDAGPARVQQFRSGAIYWTAQTGAHPVRGAIATGWAAAGGIDGVLGAPVAGETSAGAGRVQQFAGGSVYWSAATGPQVVRGAVAAAYLAAGGAAGPLGLPVSGEEPAGAAVVQRFQSGSVYWTAQGGAHPVRGGIAAGWAAAGGIEGVLGAPVAGETSAGAGRVQQFAGGSVYWSAAAGPQVVRGAVAAAYLAAGGAAGPLGLPVSAEESVGTARRQRFQSGTIFWTSEGGAHPVRGAIGTAWSATGGLTGPLGAPFADEGPLGSGAGQEFRSGVLYWTAANGVRRMTVGVRDAWLGAGGPAGALGEPTGDVRPFDGGQRVDFQRGYVVQRPGQPAQVVIG